MSASAGEPSLFRQAWEAISRLDAGALVALCDPEVTFESRITAVEQPRYRGHDGVLRFIANLREAFESIEVEPFDVVEQPDRGVVTNRFHAHGRGSGVDVEQRFFVAMQARAGRLWWWRIFDRGSRHWRPSGWTGRQCRRGTSRPLDGSLRPSPSEIPPL